MTGRIKFNVSLHVPRWAILPNGLGVWRSALACHKHGQPFIEAHSLYTLIGNSAEN